MRKIIERQDVEPENLDPDLGSLYLTDLKCDRCDGTAFVVMEKLGLRWLLACVYCNARAEGPPLEEPTENERLETAPETLSGLSFREGRYGGKTLKEVASTVEGVEYLNWYSSSGKSAFMKERVAEFLTLLGQ